MSRSGEGGIYGFNVVQCRDSIKRLFLKMERVKRDVSEFRKGCERGVALRERGAVLWTIGHSNRSIEKFVDLLEEHKIEVLVDIRSFPTSKVEHFKGEEMERWLSERGIEYVWSGKELGGYRRGGYEAHMKTEVFREGVEKLLELARQRRVCIMCMEKNPKYCHRRFLTAYLERKGVEVIHILEKGQVGLMKFKDIIMENSL